MNIKINKKEFLNSLETVSRALDSNSPISSLQGIMIKTEGSSLVVTASNKTLSIRVELNGSFLQIIKPGAILVSGSLFKNIIKKHSGTIEIIENGDLIKINSTQLNTTLNTLNVSEYPKINFDIIGKELFVDVTKLNELIHNVSYAASVKDNRTILKGVNLIADKNKITAYATNSFRIARDEMEILNEVSFNTTIDSKNLKEFIPQNAKGEIKIMVNDKKIATKHENTIIALNLIDGMYPEIERLFPREFKSKLTIDKNLFSNLLDKVSVVQDENNRTIRLTISKENMLIESKRKEVGETKIESKDFKFESSEEKLSIVVEGKFIKDALKSSKGKVVIQFNGPFEAFTIHSVGNEKTKALILPQRSY